MILYHGTMDRYAKNINKNGILLSKSKEFLDFGKGFYTTPDKRLALKTAYKVSWRNNLYNNPHANPAIVMFNFDKNKLLIMRYLKFIDQSIKWKKFIINNRLGKNYIDFFKKNEHNIDCKYDIVDGPTADGTIDTYINDIKQGTVALDQNIYKFNDFKKSLGRQISFHTKTSLSCISYIRYDIISLDKE